MRISTIRLAVSAAFAAACLTACGGGGGGASSAVAGSVSAPTTTPSNPTTTPGTPSTTPSDPTTTPGNPTTTPSDPTTTPGNPTTTPSDPTTTPGNPTTTPGDPTIQFGTAALSMAAEPGCGFDAVNVTVNKIRIHMSATAAANDAGWTELTLTTPRRLNANQLNNGATVNLGTAALVPGHYAQLRLVLDQNSSGGTAANSVVVAGASVESPLLTQIAAPDGVAVGIGSGFDIVNGQALKLVADFDACHSVVPTGSSYLLQPVINAIPGTRNGIDGFVSPALLARNVRVNVQQNGVIVRATVPDQSTGEFMLARLAPGSYELVVTADGHAAAVVSGIKIADSNAVVQLNGASSAIDLPASPTGTIEALLALEPASDIQAPFGDALEQFVSGPLVSIRNRMATLGGGNVRFTNLPLQRPSLAVWQAGQPLSFTAQAAIKQSNGEYVVSSSAPGYVTKSTLALTAQ